MGKAILLVISLGLAACAKQPMEDKDTTPSQSPTPPSLLGMQDMWEYADMSCASKFGDSNGGCVNYAQLIRFEDGSCYFFLNVSSPTSSWFWYEFIKGDSTKTTSQQLNLSGLRWRTDIDLNPGSPTISVFYDTNNSFTDSASKSLTLTKMVAQ